LNNLSLILDTGNFLFNGVLKSYKKAQGLKRGNAAKFSGPPRPKHPDIKTDYTGYDPAMLQNFMVECFTVSGVLNYELQERLKKTAEEMIKNPAIKNPKEEWVNKAKQIIPEYAKGHEPPRGELLTNYRTAMTSAYHASLWDKMQRAGIYRYLQYKTRKDGRVRESHRALDDKVFGISDPIWRRIYPPNGWNCRCYTRPITADEIGDYTKHEVPLIEPGSAEERQVIKDADITKGFDRNAAMTKSIWGKWLQEKITGKDYAEVADRIKNEINRVPDAGFVFEKLKDSAEKFIEPKLEPENFEQLFPDKAVETMIGEFKLGDNFFAKLRNKKSGMRAKLVSIIKPTLTNPEFIMVDSGYGTLFLKAFKENDMTTNYAAVIKNPKGEDEVMLISFHDKENLLNKLKGGKLLIYSRDSIPSGQGVTGKQLSYIPDHLQFNLQSKNDNVNDRNKYNEVLKSEPQEVWGEIIPGKVERGEPQAVYTSKVYGIRYGVDGFFVNDGVRAIPYDKIDQWRKGTIIKSEPLRGLSHRI
jgi:SPP1 gp7 family putative phage head morphogenesis protein